MVEKYWVDVNLDGSGRMQMKCCEDLDGNRTISFVVDGRRYVLNLSDMTVDALIVSDVPASEFDFSTRHSPESLKNGLWNILRGAMLTWIVSAIFSSDGTQSGDVVISP